LSGNQSIVVVVTNCPGWTSVGSSRAVQVTTRPGPDRELAETGRAISVGPDGLDSKTGFTSSAVAKGPGEM
jgi:hypothetical protein